MLRNSWWWAIIQKTGNLDEAHTDTHKQHLTAIGKCLVKCREHINNAYCIAYIVNANPPPWQAHKTIWVQPKQSTISARKSDFTIPFPDRKTLYLIATSLFVTKWRMINNIGSSSLAILRSRSIESLFSKSEVVYLEVYEVTYMHAYISAQSCDITSLSSPFPASAPTTQFTSTHSINHANIKAAQLSNHAWAGGTICAFPCLFIDPSHRLHRNNATNGITP